MIVVKPKVSTLFSLGIFVAACISISGYTLSIVLNSSNPQWYHLATTALLGPLGLGLLFRIVFKYKVVSVGKESIIIRFPTRFSSKNYPLKEVKMWHETAIKTAGGKYMEVEILFTDMKKLNLSMQEHTNYANVIKYMKKKASKKMK
ncbi:hypothetical protein [Fulvivirga sp.]|uniref:hypothetical protein n=1 Tax=Fulvivirga sp. TaxID=1931237 RepID=UPI0032EF1DE0